MKHWYILAYDIRDPKRLGKVHYFLKDQATALQNSVFLVQQNKAGLAELLKGVKQRANTRQDDVRLYPIANPNVIWSAGKQADAMSGLYSAHSPKAPHQSGNWLSKLFGK